MALRYGLYRSPFVTSSFRFYSTGKKLLDVSINNENGIATVTMQHPPVNALSFEMLSELAAVFPRLENNKINGLILTSLLDKKTFSAGLDLNEVLQPKPDKLRIFWRTLQDVMINLYGTSYPTVAVINGHALAGGCMLAVGCEYRIMLDNLKIGLNETQVGIMVPMWLNLAMKNTISKRDTEFVSTTSRLYTTDEALKMGLVDESVSDTVQAMERATRFLKLFERVSPMARAATKKYIREPDLEIMRKIRDEDLEAAVSLLLHPENQQAIKDQLLRLKSKKKNAQV